jgi:hypothetical protein
MIIAPLVFSTLVVGVAHMGDPKIVGRIGAKAMLWFVSASLVSLLLGLVLVNYSRGGAWCKSMRRSAVRMPNPRCDCARRHPRRGSPRGGTARRVSLKIREREMHLVCRRGSRPTISTDS